MYSTNHFSVFDRHSTKPLAREVKWYIWLKGNESGSWTPFGNPERVQRNQINKLWEPQGNPKWILEDSKIPYWHPWSTLMESHGKPLKSIRGSWSDPTGIIEKSYVELVDPMLGNDASFEKPRALSICHWLDDSQTNPENPNWFLNNVQSNIDWGSKHISSSRVRESTRSNKKPISIEE